MDSDDTWLARNLEHQFSIVPGDISHEKVLISCNITRAHENGTCGPYNKSLADQQNLSKYYLLEGGTLETSTRWGQFSRALAMAASTAIMHGDIGLPRITSLSWFCRLMAGCGAIVLGLGWVFATELIVLLLRLQMRCRR